MEKEMYTQDQVPGSEDSGRRVRPKPRMRRAAQRFAMGGLLRRPEVQRQLTSVFIVVLFMLAYIAYGYHTQQLNRRYTRLNSEVRELRTRSLYLNERRMTATRQSEILKALKEHGIELQESVVPPQVVE